MKLFQQFKHIEPLSFLSVTIILYILRMVIPFINFIFIPVLLVYSLYVFHSFIIGHREFKFADFFRFNFYLILISCFFVWGMIVTSRLPFAVIKEFLSILIILLISFSLYLFAGSAGYFAKFSDIFARQLAFFSSVAGFLGLIKYYLQLRASSVLDWSFFTKIDGTSLTSDNNFYILFTFLGIISIVLGITYFNWKIKLFNRKVIILLLIILSLNILFSYSRRALIVLVIMLSLCICYIAVNYKKGTYLLYILSRWLIYFTSIILLLTAFIFLTPVQLKKDILPVLGISVRSYKLASSSLLYKYSTIISGREYSYFKKLVWNVPPDPKDPDSNWGSRTYKLEYPLTGKNVSIVPAGSIGYRMENSTDATEWNGNSYSYTDISSLFYGDTVMTNKEFYYASVYCYVSEDFNGSWAALSDEGGIHGSIFSEYRLSEKGTWQKLQVCFNRNKGKQPVFLYWSKEGVTDFSSLTGYIIFAYPEYKIISAGSEDPAALFYPKRSTPVFPLSGLKNGIIPDNSVGYKMDSTTNFSTWDGNAYSYTDISSLFKGDNELLLTSNLISSVYCYVSEDFDGTWVRISAEGNISGKIINEYDLNKKGTWQKLEIDFKSNDYEPKVYLYWSKFNVTDLKKLHGCIIFAYPQIYLKN